MRFEILGEISGIETFAAGSAIRDVARLKRVYGWVASASAKASLRDGEAEQHGLLRIIDESGDDYFYPKALFRLIDLPETVRKAMPAAA